MRKRLAKRRRLANTLLHCAAPAYWEDPTVDQMGTYGFTYKGFADEIGPWGSARTMVQT